MHAATTNPTARASVITRLTATATASVTATDAGVITVEIVLGTREVPTTSDQDETTAVLAASDRGVTTAALVHTNAE